MASRVDVGAMMRGVSELDTGSMRIKSIPLDQLQANDNNFFAVDDVQELADNIAQHGLDNPLTVCRAERLADGRQMYRIVAGHRRRKAVELLGWQTVTCNIKKYEDADSEEIALIQSNMTARELTYYERMVAVVKLSEAYARMKERGADLSGRLRDHVVEKSRQSASAVQRMTYIYHHLSAPLMEYLKEDKLTEAVADEMAHCPKNLQASFAAKLSAGQILTAADIKAAREKPTASDGVVDAFLLRHIAAGHETALHRVLHDSHRMAASPLIPEIKSALAFYSYRGADSDAVSFVLNGSGLEVRKPFRGKLTWPQIVQRLRGMVESGKIAPSVEEAAPEVQTLRQLDEQMRQATVEPMQQIAASQPASVWHPYPYDRPSDGQIVLACKYHKYTQHYTYSALTYRSDIWYLPEDETCEMLVDVHWWSAALPPLD